MLSVTFWKKLSTYAGWIGLAILFGLILLIANLEIKDIDLWLHLAMGRYVVQNLTVPTVDVLSFTINDHSWINHEWLFQVVIHYVYQFFGSSGLINLRFIAVGLTFFILLSIGFNNRNQFVPLSLLLIVLLCYSMRMVLRPDMFSLLYFILFVYILASQIQSRGSLITLAILQILWTNTHGFFIFGPVLVFLMVLSEWIKRHIKLPYDWNAVGRYTNEEYLNLKLGLVLVILVCLVNPYHIHGLMYPVGVLTSLKGESKVFFEHITELGKPIEWHNLFDFQLYWPYRLMIILSAISFWLNRRRMDIGMFGLWALFLFLSLNALRNMIFFAAIAYLVILINLQHVKWGEFFSTELRRQKKYKHMLATGVKAILIAWMINYGLQISTRGYFDYDKMERKSEYGGITLKNYPYKAADFLVANKIKGNFFNDFNSGAYLLGRTHPDIKVFIDGRTEVYGVEYYLRHLDAWRGDKKTFDELAEEYPITGVFLNAIRQPVPARLISHIYQNPEWIPIYFDFDAMIFLRDIPQNQKWIEQFAINLEEYQTPQVDVIELGTRFIDPYPHVARAHALYDLGYFNQSSDEVLTALRLNPDDKKALKLLGKIGVNKKQYEKAFMILRRYIMTNPTDTEARYYLAVTLFQMDNLDQAEQQCLKVLEANPGNSKGLALAALIYAKQDKLDVAAKIWPKDGGELFTLQQIIDEINPDQELLNRITQNI